MRHVSELMREQKERPLDRAVNWIEYIIRHQGAHHLRSPSRHLNIFQRNLIDVALAIFAVTIFAVFAILYFINNYRRIMHSLDLRKRPKQD